MGGSPGLAQPVGFLGVGGADHVGRAGGPAGGLGPCQLVRRGGPGHVRLDHQHRGGGPVEPELVHVVDRGDREPIEQLEGDRREAGGGDRGYRIPRPVEGREEREHGRPGRRGRAEAKRRLGDDAQRPLAADDEVRQRIAGHVLEIAAPGPDDRPVGHHDLE